MTEDHEHDEDCTVVVQEMLPSWRFSMWDVAGIAFTTVGGLFSVVGQGCNLLAREFAASANYSRQNHDIREAHEYAEARRREMADELQALTGWGKEGSE